MQAMAQMGGENSEMGQAFQSAPAANNQMPSLPELGLERFKPHMTANGYDTFISLVHWGIHCQNLVEGKPMTWTDATFACMSSGFVGFGNSFLWESTYSSNIQKIVHALFTNWHARGDRYRRENKLPHLLIKDIAPLLANINRGWSHMQFVQDLISDPDTYTKL